MPFNHNDHYHSLLLRELPSPCRKSLDVGCGTGRFARALALRGIEVDAVDADSTVIATARLLSTAAGSGPIRFVQGDITSMEPPSSTYDYISCVASIHHVPIEIVKKLRASLTANGVLVILGCYREASLTDRIVSLLAVPANAICRMLVFLREKQSRRHDPNSVLDAPAPVANPSMSLAEVKAYAAKNLPQSYVRRLLFWRYLLVYRNGGTTK